MKAYIIAKVSMQMVAVRTIIEKALMVKLKFNIELIFTY
jgi:hypothetical protein